MFKFKKKSHVSVEINDYVIRGLIKKGPNSEQWQVVEIPLPTGMVEAAVITDEMALFELMKANVSNLGGKKQSVSMFIPDTSVLLKTFEHPEEIKSEKLLEYVQMELGRTIHLPFQEPLVDVYDHTPEDGHAVLFAAPSEEVAKLMGILQDIHLHPKAADIRALCNLRVLDDIGQIDTHKTYLISDWSINELSICIYSQGQVEFLRFQMIETDLVKWVANTTKEGITFEYTEDLHEYQALLMEQVFELDRMMNFFKFSLHKGEKTVDEIIIMGDNPLLDTISNFLSENIEIPLKVIDDAVIGKYYPQFKAKHAALIGLTLKEVKI